MFELTRNTCIPKSLEPTDGDEGVTALGRQSSGRSWKDRIGVGFRAFSRGGAWCRKASQPRRSSAWHGLVPAHHRDGDRPLRPQAQALARDHLGGMCSPRVAARPGDGAPVVAGGWRSARRDASWSVHGPLPRPMWEAYTRARLVMGSTQRATTPVRSLSERDQEAW